MSFRNTWVYKATLGSLAIVTGVFAWNYISPFTDELPTYQGRTFTVVSSCGNKPPGFGNPSTRPMPQSPAESEETAVSAPSASELTSAGGR